MNYEIEEKLAALEGIASQLENDTTEESVEEVKSDEADVEAVEVEASEDVEVEEAEAEEVVEEKTAEVEEETEEKELTDSEVSEVEEKAQKIMDMMKKPKGASVFLTDIRFKEMEDAGELLTDEQYESLDDEEKSMYEQVEVMNEDTKAGMGMRWRLREMMDSEEKGMNSDKKKPRSVFLTDVRYKKMMSDGTLMDDEGYDKLSDDEKGMCERVNVFNEKTKKGMGAYWRRRVPMEREQEVKKNEKSLDEEVSTKSEDEFLCGIQSKSVEEPCDFCRGGCKSEDGLPGLADIETMVKSDFVGAEILDSGYSSAEDMYLVDIRREEGDYIEIAYSGEGKQLGWFVIDPDMVEEREATDIISAKDAETSATEVIEGDVMGVFPDVFQDVDVYSVQIETAEKSYDVYVTLDGGVLGYDEYELESFDYEMSEDDEIKALEAELEIKRMYSREQRERMAEAGDALPDGSYPIADKADLQNAIQAFGRAKDKDAAKKHIVKRAKELGLEDMLPEDWMSDDDSEGGNNPASESEEAEAEGMKDALAAEVEEFQRLLEELGTDD